MIRLIIREADKPEAIREFNTTEVTIGRGKANDLILVGTGVSKRHARLVLDQAEKAVTVHDLCSTNGTALNGIPFVGSRTLGPNDKINIAGFTIEVPTTDKTRRAAPAESTRTVEVDSDHLDECLKAYHSQKLADEFSEDNVVGDGPWDQSAPTQALADRIAEVRAASEAKKARGVDVAAGVGDGFDAGPAELGKESQVAVEPGTGISGQGVAVGAAAALVAPHAVTDLPARGATPKPSSEALAARNAAKDRRARLAARKKSSISREQLAATKVGCQGAPLARRTTGRESQVPPQRRPSSTTSHPGAPHRPPHHSSEAEVRPKNGHPAYTVLECLRRYITIDHKRFVYHHGQECRCGECRLCRGKQALRDLERHLAANQDQLQPVTWAAVETVVDIMRSYILVDKKLKLKKLNKPCRCGHCLYCESKQAVRELKRFLL